MVRILIVYGTNEGHTARIAERMAAAIRDKGHTVILHDAAEVRRRRLTDTFDGVLIGGSLRAGDYQSSLREFVKRNRTVLERVPSAFFSVSLAATDADDETRADIQATVGKFANQTGWHPQRVELIAGNLVYTQYNLFIRHLMKLIVKHQGRTELDTSRDYEFTDWDAVERFARAFAASIGDGRGDAGRSSIPGHG